MVQDCVLVFAKLDLSVFGLVRSVTRRQAIMDTLRPMCSSHVVARNIGHIIFGRPYFKQCVPNDILMEDLHQDANASVTGNPFIQPFLFI